MDSDLERTTFSGDEPGEAVRRPRDASLAAGDVLNGIYKVERFIARGGMGEVFEGVNVETDERVAIKAIRSHLASDPKIVALFRKEARVLTHIAHPAIVQYRVFARDPQLDLHYIVTDYINGEPITRHLDHGRPSLTDVITLARRLASGLEAAHDHGAIHRDMSPDNILLPDGKIDRAKIIDFGIAKSLDITAETVVGEGFAGKLGYVAPEQFGDFGRQIGPWTDVYSTALVLLAFARGKAPAMGTTLSEAVESRRIPVDLSELPVALAPLLERMLVSDPAKRIRSMREVLVALDGIRITADQALIGGKPAALPDPDDSTIGHEQRASVKRAPLDDGVDRAAPPMHLETAATLFAGASVPDDKASPQNRDKPVQAVASAPGKPDQPSASRPTKSARNGRGKYGRHWIAALVAGLAVLFTGVFLHRKAADTQAIPVGVEVQGQQPVTHAQNIALLAASDRAEQWNLAVRDLPCGWITARPTTEEGPTELSGGSGDVPGLPARLAGRPRNWGGVETKDVETLNVTQCGVIDALRPYRAKPGEQGAGVLALSTSRILLDHRDPACPGGGVAEVTAASRDPDREWALIGLEPDGRLLQIAGSKAEFVRLAHQQRERFSIGSDKLYHASLCHSMTGSSAIFLLETKRPIDLGLHTGQAALPGSDFAQRLADQGRDQGMRIFAQWARIEAAPMVGQQGPASGTASPPVNGLRSSPQRDPVKQRSDTEPVQQHESSREQSAVDTAELNRRELVRIQDTQAPNRNTDFCRSYDGQWHNVGFFARDACLALAIRGHCNVTYAMSDTTLYRRRGSWVQEQRGNRWRTVEIDKSCESR